MPNIIRYFSKSTSVCIKLVLSNKEDAYVLRRAESLGSTFQGVSVKDQWGGRSNSCFIKEFEIDFVVLATSNPCVPDVFIACIQTKL